MPTTEAQLQQEEQEALRADVTAAVALFLVVLGHVVVDIRETPRRFRSLLQKLGQRRGGCFLHDGRQHLH